MPRNPDRPLLVQGAMTEDERRLFLERFTELNRNWKGAHVADVLALLYDHEEHLPTIEQIAKDAKEENESFEQNDLFDYCVLAVLYAYGPEVTTWEKVEQLLVRAEDACPHCFKPDCYEHCKETADGHHVLDPKSANSQESAELVDQDEGTFVVDVNCAKCGQSGSVTAKMEDIAW